MNKPHQRIGSQSNAEVGKKFEIIAREFFRSEGLQLETNFKLAIGVGEIKKEHAFDLGNGKEKVLVECKSHKWTAPGENIPSAKLTVWNEAMYYFLLAPPEYRKIMFVLHDFSKKRNETLAQYYIRTYPHLIPEKVEFWEFNEARKTAKKLPLD